jgi:putative transport protein
MSVHDMRWIFQLHATNPTAQAIAILAFVCVVGMGFGAITFRGIKLGTSGVLFAGILVGHFSKPIDHHTLEFVKEFGLILFVFCIGLQLGPGFFASLRHTGLRLNLLALGIIVLGVACSVGLGWLLTLDSAAVLGVFSGATTNTPSLGAAQQTLASFPDVTDERAALPALAYAVTYPIGIVGIIGTLLALKSVFKIDVAAELQAFMPAGAKDLHELERRTLVVENPNLHGVSVADVPGLIESGVIVSRIRRAGEATVCTAMGAARLSAGDILFCVGTAQGLDRFQRAVGRVCHDSLPDPDSPVKQQNIVLTRKLVAGKTVQELSLSALHDVVVVTVTRGDVELIASPQLQLRFGDVLQVVGPEQGLNGAASVLGNSVDALHETQFVPFFAGIGTGILLGTLPIPCPGLPQPLKFGLAGGPLIVAIIVGRLGRVGRLVWHMPRNTNLAFRELGIALFFASVGLLAGPTFFSAACSIAGVKWLLAGACVTVIPLLVVGVVARRVLALNYVELSGLLAGSMTDPPALAFASSLCHSESPAVAYATVYPLTMLLRIMSAQVLAVVLCS